VTRLASRVVSRDDDFAARTIFVGRAVTLVLAATNASTSDVRFDKLNVDLVVKIATDAARWVTPASSTAIGIILSSTIAPLKTIQTGYIDASGKLSVFLSSNCPDTIFKSDLLPEICRDDTSSSVARLGTVNRHAAGVLRSANASVLLFRDDHAEVGGGLDVYRQWRTGFQNTMSSFEILKSRLWDWVCECRAYDGERGDKRSEDVHLTDGY